MIIPYNVVVEMSPLNNTDQGKSPKVEPLVSLER